MDDLRRKIALVPADGPCLAALAGEQRRSGNAAGAAAWSRAAFASEPTHPAVLNEHAIDLIAAGSYAAASRRLRSAIALAPALTALTANYGLVRRNAEPVDDVLAAVWLNRALAADSTAIIPRLAMADVAMAAECPASALRELRRGMAVAPDDAEVPDRLGWIEYGLGRPRMASPFFARAATLDRRRRSAARMAHVAHLLDGNYRRGWPAFDWRYRDALPFPPPPAPLWSGESRAGSRLLVLTEEGFGDSIQMARFLPGLASRGMQVLLGCPMELARLFRTLPNVTVLAHGEAAPPFDSWIPLMSLPGAIGLGLEDLPGSVPYLRPPDTGPRVARESGMLSVGLVWAGRPTHPRDRERSIPQGLLAPLLAVEGVRFFDIRPRHESRPAPSGMINFRLQIDDFADTAAVLSQLDLVITIDSAVAHLAGALGRPVWTLLGSLPDWRWLLERTDSPWYPTMRLYRQPRGGTWDAVLTAVAGNLAQLVSLYREGSFAIAPRS